MRGTPFLSQLLEATSFFTYLTQVVHADEEFLRYRPSFGVRVTRFLGTHGDKVNF